ncbi:MAG: response regulator [Gammaproteobacteria bacterium]
MTTNSTKSVVVVDDSPSLITLFRRGAEHLDIELQIFSSTTAAWSYLEENKPDLLFLNIKMPGKDGFTILRELRELPLHSDTSVVMISSKDYAQDRSIARELGALDFITKPMPIQVIKDAMIKHLGFDSP